MTDRDAGGATAGPPVDLGRLTDRELDAWLAEWMGWRRMSPRWMPGVWVLVPPGFAWGDVRWTPSDWTEADPQRCAEALDAHNHVPAFSTTHDGAAALRAHVRSLGEPAQRAFLAKLVGVIMVQPFEPGQGAELSWRMVDAGPRQQAEAAYMAFLHRPPTT